MLVVLGVIAGIAAVGLAARGEPGEGGARSVTLAPGTGEAASTIGAYLFVALAAVVLAALVWSAAGGGQRKPPPRPRRSLIRSLVTVLLVLLLVSQFDRPAPPSDDVPVEGPGELGGGDDDAAAEPADPASPAGALAVAGLAVLLLAGGVVHLLRSQTPPADGDGDAGGSAAAPATDAPRPDVAELLERERDPRRAVLLAFAAAEARLASTPAARRPSTSPREWLALVRAKAPAAAAPLAEVVARYEIARFSDHPVAEHDRHAAIEAVRALP